MKLPTPAIVRGDARALPLPDEFVDLIVTSPPYFGLRSYTDNGEHYDGQIGSEPTPQEFIAALVECTREMVRVLKPGGSIFINLGDKYAQDMERSRNGLGGQLDGGKPLRDARETVTRARLNNGVPRKSLMLLPERFRIACVDQLGLIARAVIVWAKPNGLPESVTDRVRRSHEDWVHLTKQPKYFASVDEIREPTSYVGPTWEQRKARGQPMRHGDTGGGASKGAAGGMAVNPLGSLPGSVWTIATQPLKVPAELGVDHFASFPMAWPRRLIQGWCPTEVCTACGLGLTQRRTDGQEDQRSVAGRVQARAGMPGLRDDGRPPGLRPPGQGDEVVSDFAVEGSPAGEDPAGDREVRRPVRVLPHEAALGGGHEGTPQWAEATAVRVRSSIHGARDVPEALHEVEAPRQSQHRVPRVGASACECEPGSSPTTPGVVLDPFSGTGTTSLVATMLGRVGIGVDLSADYNRLAEWRAADPKERARAAGLDPDEVAAIRPQLPGQGSLLDLFEEDGEPA